MNNQKIRGCLTRYMQFCLKINNSTLKGSSKSDYTLDFKISIGFVVGKKGVNNFNWFNKLNYWVRITKVKNLIRILPTRR